MDEATFRLMYGAAAGDVGQQEWTTPGTYEFIVPHSTYYLSAVVIGSGGGGGRGAQATDGNGGIGAAGGNTRWIRGLPVTPGEVLAIYVAAGGLPRSTESTLPTSGAASYIARGNTILLRADGAGSVLLPGTNNSPIGTQPDGSVIGGGNGGEAGDRRPAGGGGPGGGAGGYSGNGGQPRPATGSPITTPSGGAAGGGGPDGGGSVGLKGEGASGVNYASSASGSDGSAVGVTCGGGGNGGAAMPFGNRNGTAGKNGGIRIIWGDGRWYPSTRTADEFY